MVRNEEKYQQAVEFRKRGFTYSEIAKICDVSKGTVSNWLKNEVFSQRVYKQNKKQAVEDNKKRLSLIHKARQAERNNRYKESIKSAETEYKHYKNNPLFTAGLMIYAAAGDKKSVQTIRLSSVEMPAQKIFHKFLREYLGLEKSDIHFWLLLKAGQSEESCMKKWSRALSLPYGQFYKNQYIQGGKKETLHHGVGNTIIGNTVLKKKLVCWIELASKELSK